MISRLQAAYRALVAPVAIRSDWDAAGRGNRAANWAAQPTAPNAWQDQPAILRARAESEYRNNPWARRAVNSWIGAAIGHSGIVPMTKDKAFRAAWDAWSEDVDAMGRLSWTEFQAQVLQTVMVSGEGFILFGIDASKQQPLTVLIVGPEFLDTSRTGPNTFAGIEFEGLKRSAYWLHRRNPNAAEWQQSIRVPADQVVHVFRPLTAGAQRGVSWLAPVLLPLREIQEYTESMLVRAKTGALYSGFVRTADGTNPLKSSTGDPALEPGSMTRLGPGEEVEFTNPPDSGATFDPFVNAQLRKIAAGLSMPFEVLSGDHRGVTFASGRHGLVEWRRQIEAVQYSFLVPQLCAPILRKWLDMALALGVIEERPKGLRWIGPQLEMLDPKSETAATVAKIRAGLLPRSEAIAISGWDADAIDAEYAADNVRADRLGLVFDSDARRVTQQGMNQQEAPQP